MPKFPCPYSYPHRSRKDRAGYIRSIGGYSDRFDCWPLEFNVSAHLCDFSFDHLWDTYAPQHLPFAEGAPPCPAQYAAYHALARRTHAEAGEAHLWSIGQEDAYDSLHEDEFYRTLWGGGEVSVSLELRGRGGKHLVISDFEGVRLSGMSADALYEMLMRQTSDITGDCTTEAPRLLRDHSWEVSDAFVATLYKYVRQCEQDFTPTAASAAVEQYGADYLFANRVAAAWEEELAQVVRHAEAVDAAVAVKTALVFSTSADVWEEFNALCRAAGVSEDEVENG